MGYYEAHEFYCIKCGKRGIPISRDSGHRHKKFHKKKLFCLTCQQEVNHIECRNETEVNEFKEKFRNGEYENEETLSDVRPVWCW